MHGNPEAGPTGAAAPPPDWPAPGSPLPGEEPTAELPVVTAAMLAGSPPTSSPTLAAAALALALDRRTPAGGRRFPALERRGPRPAAVPLDDLLLAPAPPAAPAADEVAPAGRRWATGAGIAAVALLLTGTAVVVLSRDDRPSQGAPTGWSPPAAAAPHTLTAALGGRTAAGFDLVDGARQVTVRAAELGDTLYRISTPESGTVTPRAEGRDDRVRLRLDGDAGSVDITLNAAVRWDLRVTGGAQVSTIDLSAGRVGGVELTGGADRIDLTLPPPDGTLGVRMSGGVSLFDVRTAERTPVRVRVGRGAGRVTLNGEDHAGVAAGRTFTPAAWADAVDRIDVDAAAGMSALTVAPY